MPEVDAMKSIIFLVITFSLQFALGAQAFSGSLTKKGDEFFYTPKSSQLFYKVVPMNFDVHESLTRLEDGDYVAGNGSLDTVNKKISVHSIDYVGLRKLLGPWVGADGTMVFKDFTTMRFTPRFRDIKMDTHIAGYQKEFRYSVSPKDGNEWALFLSDDTNTTFATVEFTKKKIIMKIFESESGNIVRTLKLERP